MVNFLMQIHPIQRIGLNFSIGPPDIPITYPLLILNNPAQLLPNFRNNGILSITDIEYNFFVLGFIWQFGYGYDFGAIIGVEFKLII